MRSTRGRSRTSGTGAVITPIFQVSTYKQDGIGGFRGGYEYSRSANPTRTALEECFAALEGGARGFAFSSGLAGQDTVLRALLAPGDHVVVPSDAYGGTYRLFNKVLSTWGVEHTIAHDRRPRRRCAPRSAPGRPRSSGSRRRPTRCSASPTSPPSPTSPTSAGALLVVDNTFASPYLQQPLALGADIVTHSTTKYCGGHSDVVGGAVVVGHDITVPGFEDAVDRVAFHQNSMGAVAGPMDAWLVLRGLKTLALRMERHSDNAERVVEFLHRPPGRQRRPLPGPGEPPRPRGRQAPDEAVRRHDLVPGQGRARTSR